ncbi:MAG: chromosomal replication initiator protein DnaA [Candidatus Scalindua sp.]|jgi:chromosomal replication initiator protein|nr:chromosomal replication initiator protein DnaA [Candidatus Scalindua sp.]MBT6229096.1 chromosomal replication initiator protein DnaA [Candidatus Scalindua sp.]MBT6564281.1 chromosomal replication initiator protein DnaA [Candidatus Scalindua sp.]MBT7212948.1 chromosomal replication initiator protein DnaA [Candidatus Scalindua sp.]MBT7589971.1 chromosomal replication initiator protein DnaA [Candidatus Scalindua sp.]
MNHSTTKNSTDIWEDVLDAIKAKVGIRQYNLWFNNTHLISFENESLSIGVPNQFVLTKIRENYEPLIKDLIKEITKVNPAINLHVEGNGHSKISDKAVTGNIKFEKPSNQDNGFINNSKLLLENYIVGGCNRLAYAAALEISKPGPVAFNTLFIHGSIGVGKTHLLQGIWNRLNSESSSVSAVYMPAENWTNEFVYALKGGRLESFRKKYRSVDIFLVDDVHFLANKNGVQEEFIHTFNTLHGLSKRIVFASDAHPKFMNQLKESLVSRFMSGMIAKVEQPSVNTSIQILRSKTANARKKVPDNVLEFISEKFNDSVRSMESAVTTVMAYANMSKVKIDLKLATETLSELYNNKKSITLKDIEGVVVSHYNVSRSDIHSANKSKNIALTRQICMYLAKVLTESSYQEIGKYFGNKRHTTVIFAIKKLKEKSKSSAEFQSQIENLIRMVKKQ